MPEPDIKKRTIRSFVRRAGRITASQQRALDELWTTYGIDYRDEPLDFSAVFGRSAPVVLEIGFGNGESLVEQAAANPDKDYVGIEVHEPGVGHCLLKASAAGLTNLRVIAHDAVEVLTKQVPAGPAKPLLSGSVAQEKTSQASYRAGRFCRDGCQVPGQRRHMEYRDRLGELRRTYR
jgi:tRNA (guanine-N7-)-methyltransferase